VGEGVGLISWKWWVRARVGFPKKALMVIGGTFVQTSSLTSVNGLMSLYVCIPLSPFSDYL